MILSHLFWWFFICAKCWQNSQSVPSFPIWYWLCHQKSDLTLEVCADDLSFFLVNIWNSRVAIGSSFGWIKQELFVPLATQYSIRSSDPASRYPSSLPSLADSNICTLESAFAEKIPSSMKGYWDSWWKDNQAWGFCYCQVQWWWWCPEEYYSWVVEIARAG